MIKDAAKKQFQYVIVWKLDRFARNRYDSAIYKAKLKKYGIKVLSVMENITDSPEGIILEGMLESLAEYYSASLSENVKRGQRESIAKGRFTGGVVPYGYKSENGRLVENERTAPIIRSVFKQYAEGVPMKKIIDNLREKGIKSPSGGQLRYSSFEVALKNPVYIGKLMRKGQEVVGCADPLIDEETFQRVQERRKTSARAPATAKAKIEYQLQGKRSVGFVARIWWKAGTSRNGSKYYYYTCSARKRDKSCDKAAEKKGFIEWYVCGTNARICLISRA